jgi:hypothetical protein
MFKGKSKGPINEMKRMNHTSDIQVQVRCSLDFIHYLPWYWYWNSHRHNLVFLGRMQAHIPAEITNLTIFVFSFYRSTRYPLRLGGQESIGQLDFDCLLTENVAGRGILGSVNNLLVTFYDLYILGNNEGLMLVQMCIIMRFMYFRRLMFIHEIRVDKL